MTKEQLKKGIDDRRSQIKNLELEITKLKETFLSEQKMYEVGEKVEVIETSWNGIEKKHTAFIGGMTVSSDGTINYTFLKVKKDGTPSSHKLFVWNYCQPRKLNSEQNAQASVATEVK